MSEIVPVLKINAAVADATGKFIASSLLELVEEHPEAKKVIFTIVPNGKKIDVRMCWE